MTSTLARRTASNLRAALAIVAFTVLAAVGFAAARHLEQTTKPAAMRARAAAPGERVRAGYLDAPAGAPLSTSVFRAGY